MSLDYSKIFDYKYQTLSAMDVLVPTSMKNAAKCDTSCELQNQRVIKTLNAPCTSFGEYVCWSVCISPPQTTRLYRRSHSLKGMCIEMKNLSSTPQISTLVVGRQTEDMTVILIFIVSTVFCNICAVTSYRTSNQSRIPAEFKHITRRRKRN